MKNKKLNIMVNCIMLILMLFCMMPIILLFVGACMTDTTLLHCLGPLGEEKNSYTSWIIFPIEISFKAYIKVLFDSPEYFVAFWNSMKVAISVTVGQVVVGMPAAWALAKYKFKGKKIVEFLYLIIMFLPFQTVMLPQYIMLEKLGLLDTLIGIIVIGIFQSFPVFLMLGSFKNIPDSLVEAAEIDGANDFTIFTKIAVPLATPGIISSMILNFLEYWNIVEQPMIFLKTKSLWTLSLFLPKIDLSNARYAFGASVIMIIPCIALFREFSEELENGVASLGESK
ncbi:carbohydrate ABC transporter permease [Lachnobacterium bovis]|uniref:Multiple sugar transport system permease protein n=1 Tax=Lachnobacterium bovis TaxID=140626 RepID=A0A1H9SP75_9FIRM|nr:carbohydrate ABC transporter permease [Lachnobacterium bovis]SER86810.1 multiple sugar transport system permease protein [Lachnobacterium bovis]